jgi:cytochrome P450
VAAERTASLAIAPGPAGLPVLGSLRPFQKDPLGFLLALQRDYGDVARFRMGPRLAHLVSRPEWVRHVLATNQENYGKSVLYRRLEPTLGKGLLTSDGAFWRRQRRLAEPAFHLEQVGGFAATMVEATAAMLARWETYAASGQPFDVVPELSRLAMTIATRTLFGADVDAESSGVTRALTVVMRHAIGQILALWPVPDSWPTPGNLRARRALRVLDAVVYEMIAARRAAGEPSTDLLSMLVYARDPETGETMNDRQLRDEVMTLFLAGHETTADALAWTVYLLGQHPAAARRLEAEVDAVLDGRPPTLADVPRLSYTLMVFQEAMRLYPPGWVISRTPRQDDTIGGYHIPAGSTVIVSQYVLHRHPDYWDRPARFDPERFADRGKPAYFPFAAGPRVCIGNNFALLEARLALAMVAQRYRLSLVPGQRVDPEPLVTLRPHPGVWVTLQPRESPVP